MTRSPAPAATMSGPQAPTAETSTSLSYWVSKPADNDPNVIRYLILVEHFGYFDEEVEPFIKFADFKIINSKTVTTDGVTKTITEAATSDHVESWPVLDGKVEISLPLDLVEKIRKFHANYLKTVLGRFALGIRDPELATAFIAFLSAILSSDMSGRTAAATAFMNRIGGRGSDLVGLEEALDKFELADETAYPSPYVALVKATLAVDRAGTQQGPGFDTAAMDLLQEARRRLDAAVGQGDRPIAASDIDMINGRLALGYEALGDEEAALQRRWVARFASMTPAERAQYREGDVVSMDRPGQTSMSSPSQARLRLNKADADWMRRRDQLQSVPSTPKNADRDNALNRFVDEDSFRTEYERVKNRNAKNSQGKRPYVEKYRATQNRPLAVRSQPGLARAGRAKGGVDLPLTILKWAAAARFFQEFAAYEQKRRPLQSAVDRENRRMMPPKPALVRQQLAALLRMGEGSLDPQTEAERQRLVRYLRGLLDESIAAWQ